MPPDAGLGRPLVVSLALAVAAGEAGRLHGQTAPPTPCASHEQFEAARKIVG